MEEGKAKIGGFIRDPLHGYVELTRKEFDIIDNPTFQRLRRIGQLSFVDSTYPSGTHTRFSHSLGVMKLAQMFHRIDGCEKITPEWKESLELAGLLHDIGHFPFSHAFEPAFFEFVEKKSNPELKSWKNAHVRMGVKILKSPNHGFIEILGDKVDRICSLIDSTSKSENLPKVVNAILTGTFSIDRLDYLKRDAHHCGTPEYGIVDQQRIISSFINYKKVPDLEVYNEKALYALENLILSYFFMYRAVYYHKTVRATSLLFQSILWDAFEEHVFKNVKWDDPKFWNEFDDCGCLSMLRDRKELFPERLEKLLNRETLTMIDEKDYKEKDITQRIFMVCKSYRDKISVERKILENLSEKWSFLQVLLLDSPYLVPYDKPNKMKIAPQIWDKKDDSSPNELSEKAAYLNFLDEAYYGKGRVYINKIWEKNELGAKKKFIEDLIKVIRELVKFE